MSTKAGTDAGTKPPPASGRRMAYERSRGDGAPGAHPRRTRLIVLLIALALAAGGFALFGRSSTPTSPADIAAAHAAEKVVSEADNLLANLGAPRPPGTTSPAWAVEASPTVTRRGSLMLRNGERPWLDQSGKPLPLSKAEATEIATTQGSQLRQLFTGGTLRDLEGQLSGIVAKEQRWFPVPSSPGGTSLVQWFTPAVSGSTARIEGQVNEWEQHDDLVAQGKTALLHTSVNATELDVTAHLLLVDGGWKITELDQGPYQQAT